MRSGRRVQRASLDLVKILAYILVLVVFVSLCAFCFWTYKDRLFMGEQKQAPASFCSEFEASYALVYYTFFDYRDEKKEVFAKIDLCSGETTAFHKEDFQIRSANISPDKSQIAYIIDKGSYPERKSEVVVVNPKNNSHKRIPLGFSIADNSKLVWKSTNEVSLLSWNFDLYILNVEDESIDKIFHFDKETYKYPSIIQQLAWNQAGTTLFFTADNEPQYISYNHKGSISGVGIYKISFEKNNKVEKIGSDYFNWFNFSPTKKKIAYTGMGFISILDIETKKEELVKQYYDVHKEVFWSPGLIWSPNGEEVVFTRLLKRQTEKKPPFLSTLETLNISEKKTETIIDKLPDLDAEPVAWVGREIYFVSGNGKGRKFLLKYNLDDKKQVKIGVLNERKFLPIDYIIGFIKN